MADTETHQAIGVGVGGSTKQFRNLKAVFPLPSWAQKKCTKILHHGGLQAGVSENIHLGSLFAFD